MRKLILSLGLVGLTAGLAYAEDCAYPVTTQVLKKDVNDNVVIAGTTGCASRVVRVTEGAILTTLKCSPEDPIVAVVIKVVGASFEIDNIQPAVEHYYCASQLKGK